MQSKIENEKDFHNKRFSVEVRQAAQKFYSIERASRDRFKFLIKENSRGKNILELGSGKGSYAFNLAEDGAIVYGIDISDVAIEYSIEKARSMGLEKSTNFKVMNAEELTFSDGEFDRLFGSSILHHLDMDKSIAGLSRVLSSEGKAVFIEPLGHNIFINLYRKLTPNYRTEDEHPFVVEDFKIFHKYFGKVEIDYFHLTTLFAVPFRKYKIFDFILMSFQKLDRLLFKIFPFIRKQAWQIVVTASEPTRRT